MMSLLNAFHWFHTLKVLVRCSYTWCSSALEPLLQSPNLQVSHSWLLFYNAPITWKAFTIQAKNQYEPDNFIRQTCDVCKTQSSITLRHFPAELVLGPKWRYSQSLLQSIAAWQFPQINFWFLLPLATSCSNISTYLGVLVSFFIWVFHAASFRRRMVA